MNIFRFINLLIISILTSSAAFGAAPSTMTLFKTPINSRVELSPSGDNIAFVRSETKLKCVDSRGQIEEGKTNCPADRKRYRATYRIIIFDLNTSKATLNFPLPEDFYPGWITWATEDRLLASISRRTTANEKRTKGSIGGSRIVSIPRTEGEVVTLFDGSAFLSRSNFRISSVTDILRDDPDHVLIPAYRGDYLDLWKVNILDGSFERVAKGKFGTFDWYTDKTGKPILRYDQNKRSTHISVFAWSDADNDWLKIRDFKLKTIEDDVDDFDFYPVAPTENPKQFYVLSREKHAARASIKIYDLEKQDYVETVFEHDTYDAGGAITNVETGQYEGAWYYGDRRQLVYLDKKQQAHFNGLNGFFEDRYNIELLGFDQTDSKAVILASATDDPGGYYLYDIANARITPLMSRRPDIDPSSLGKSEILRVPTRDGSVVTAYLTSPRNKTAGTEAPLLVMPHGGPEARDYFDYDRVVQYFASRGYQVLQVNFRGSSGYGRSFAEAGYGEWGGVMQNDVTDAVKFVHDRGDSSPEKTCIVGYSYGGYVAAYGAATTGELYSCAVSGGAASDLIASLQETKDYYGADSETYDYWTKSIGKPGADREKLTSRSPINLASQISIPVLLIHGEYDTIENVRQSRRMFRELKQEGKDVEYLELDYQSHSGWGMGTWATYLKTVEAFLSKHLPTE